MNPIETNTQINYHHLDHPCQLIGIEGKNNENDGAIPKN